MARTRGGRPPKRAATGSSRPSRARQPSISSEDEVESSDSSRPRRTAIRPPPDLSQNRILHEHIDQAGKLWFSSSWHTRFIFCLAPEYPLRAVNTYIEVAPNGHARTPSNVTAIEITSAGQRRWLYRCVGNYPDFWQLISDRMPSSPPDTAAPVPSSTQEEEQSVASTSYIPRQPKSTPQHAPDVSEVLGMSWRPSLRPAADLSSESPMLPPPESTFPTVVDAIAFAKNWAIAHGYSLSVESSNPKKRYYYFRCYRGGHLPEERHQSTPDSTSNLKAKESSRMDAKCPFALTVSPSGDSSGISVQNPHHSGHKCDPKMFENAHQHLTAEEEQVVLAMRETDADIRPMTIRRALNRARQQADPQIPDLVGTKIVSNALARAKMKAKGTQKLVETIVLDLGAHSFNNRLIAQPWQNAEGRLVGLFVSHKLIHPILANVPHVLLIDTTYSLNRNGYPLVQIGAHLPWGIPIVVACALVEHEDTATFAWVLEQYLRLRTDRKPPGVVITDADEALSSALAIVMPNVPHILCQWHAAENIEHKGGRHLLPGKGKELRKLWEAVVGAETYEGSEVKWAHLCNWLKGEEGGGDARKYIEAFWRLPENFERLANCHVNRYKHYGHKVTSEIEGQHRSLKSYLPKIANCRRMDMTEFLQRLEEWLGQRRLQIGQDLDKEKISELWLREDDRLAKVKGVITKEAIRKALSNLNTAQVTFESNRRAESIERSAALPCTADLPTSISCDESVDPWDQPLSHEACPVWTSEGVPCEHRLLLIIAAGRQHLLPSDFTDFHWLPETLSYEEPSLPLSQGTNSSIPNAFEDLADFIRRLEERYPSRVPLDHAKRLDRAFEAYITETYNPTGLSQPFQAPPDKAPLKQNAQAHDAAARLLTGNELHQKTQSLTLYSMSRRCGACGEAGHKVSDCIYKGDSYAQKRAAWQEEKRAMERERAKKARAKRKAERMADLALVEAAADEVDEATVSEALKGVGEQEEDTQGPQDGHRPSDTLAASPPPVPDGTDALEGLASHTEVLDHEFGEFDMVWETAFDGEGSGAGSYAGSTDFLQALAQAASLASFVHTPMIDPSLEETYNTKDDVTQPEPPARPLMIDPPIEEAKITQDLVTQTKTPARPRPKPLRQANQPQDATQTVKTVSDTDDDFQMLNSQTKLGPSLRRSSRRLPDPATMPGFRPLVDIDTKWRAAKVRTLCSTGNLIRTERTGHCGYDAVAKQLPQLFSTSLQVRKMLLMYLNGKAQQDFDWKASSHWQSLKAKIVPNGVWPSAEEEEEFAKGVSEELWLSDEVLPYLAQALQTPICVMGNTELSQWSTHLPVTLASTQEPPPKPIGLWYTQSHWEGVAMRQNGPLPPPVAVWWGHRAEMIVKTEDHAFIHASYSFLRWKKTDKGCGCVW